MSRTPDSLASLAALAIALWLSPWSIAFAKEPADAAAAVATRIESPHPYAAPGGQGGVAWHQAIEAPGRAFVTLRVARLELAPGDALVVSDRNGRVAHRYEGRGPRPDGGAFWTLSVPGGGANVALHRAPAVGEGAAAETGSAPAWGVLIDRIAFGPATDPAPEIDALCGADDSRDAACYADLYPDEFERSRAVVRLVVGGTKVCSGFLASCANHIVTSALCVGSQAELDQTEIQFGVAREACDGGEAIPERQIQGGTLLDVDGALDYALFLPAATNGFDPRGEYGYVKLETRAPVVDEPIYIAGHPAGRPARLAIESSHPEDQSGRCEIASIDEPACTGSGATDVGYYCDTEGGSQGSPVLAARTHGAVALHHCANCPNRGVPMEAIVASIESRIGPLPRCATCAPGGPVIGTTAAANGDNRIRVTWSAAPSAARYRVYRARGGCGEPFLRIADIPAATSFVDTAASAGVTYGYRVSSVDETGCESERSLCASASTAGACLEAPLFDGLTTAASSGSASCGVALAWSAATSRCAGGSVRTNIYRSAVPGFTPSPANRIATCIEGTNFTDATVADGQTYYYIARAEDTAAAGAGPCGGGAEDTNAESRAATPSGPEDVYFQDDFESGFGWTLEGEWEITSPSGFGGVAEGGSGGTDPFFAWDGFSVLGVDLTGFGTSFGNYENGITSAEHATSPVFDASGRSEARVRFVRWLCTERSRYDQSFVEAWDGTNWTRLWTNPDVSFSDAEWTPFEVDATTVLAGRSDAQLRFGVATDGDVRYCGWNVDGLQVYERRTCSAGALGTRPVPDGKFTGGAAMLAAKGAGTAVSVTFDATLCPSSAYHLLHGDAATLPAGGTISGATCSLSTSGSATATVPTPPPGSARYFVIVGASGSTESLHGYDSRGERRTSRGTGFCGIASQDTDAVCP